MGTRTRVRQHVNPLKAELQVVPPPLVWAELFADPTAPLVVDVGCGPGRWGLALAARTGPGTNVLGMDIRGKLVERANAWARARGLGGRVACVEANATVALPAGSLASYPGPLTLLAVQYPDPHFKARHKKRRTVQPAFAVAAAEALAPGGVIFLQSDVEEVSADMRNVFEGAAGSVLAPGGAHGDAPEGGWAAAGWAAAGWLAHNPTGVPTEREVHTLAQGKPVFRTWLVKQG